MAVRPVFLSRDGVPGFRTIDVEFKWHPGLSRNQKERSIRELHKEFSKEHGDISVLEVSSRSSSDLGRALSAFNLSVTHAALGRIALESAFQGSKVFAELGQIEHAYVSDPRTAKRLAREVDSEHCLVEFCWEGESWPLEPKTLFYDWLYCSALHEHPNLMAELQVFRAFTDIEFNPAKSFNCQARSCAIAVSLIRQGLFDKALANRRVFVDFAYRISGADDGDAQQLTLI